MRGLYKDCVFSIKNTVSVFATIARVILSQEVKQLVPDSRKIKFIMLGGGGESFFQNRRLVNKIIFAHTQ